MSLYRLRRTRSSRLTLTTPDGQTLVAENLSGDTGFAMSFEAKRTMDENPGEYSAVAWNLPADVLEGLEAAQGRRINDPDRILVDEVLRDVGVPPDGSAALEGGWLVAEFEAGYDGVVSRVFRGIGARISTERVDDGCTTESRISIVENLDAILLGDGERSFPPGASTFELVDYLRGIAGLGPGNLTPALLTALLGESKLSSGYHCAGGQALTRLKSVLEYLPLRWFVDDRELWICGRDGVPNAGGVPAYVPDEIGEPDILLSRPRRVDGGMISAECFLCPRLRVGRLVNLTEAGLALALQGLSPSEQAIAYAEVPPGLYRLDEVTHDGSWTTRMMLRPGVAML